MAQKKDSGHYKKHIKSLDDLTISGKYTSIKLNNLLLNVKIQKDDIVKKLRPITLLEVTYHNLWKYRLSTYPKIKMIDTEGFQYEHDAFASLYYSNCITNNAGEEVGIFLPETTLEAHAKTNGWLFFKALRKNVLPHRLIFILDVFKPGDLSGWVQNRETLEFIFSSRRVVGLFASHSLKILGF